MEKIHFRIFGDNIFKIPEWFLKQSSFSFFFLANFIILIKVSQTAHVKIVALETAQIFVLR